jgi:hypothetical protein
MWAFLLVDFKSSTELNIFSKSGTKMNLLLKILFALIDMVCFAGGSILFIYSVSRLYSIRSLFSGDDGYYGYNTDSSEYIAVGIGLIVLGMVIRSWRKDYRSIKKK